MFPYRFHFSGPEAIYKVIVNSLDQGCPIPGSRVGVLQVLDIILNQMISSSPGPWRTSRNAEEVIWPFESPGMDQESI